MATTAKQSARETLVEAVGVDQVRDASEHDVIHGVRPTWIVSANDTEQVAAAMRAAAGHELRVVPTGSRSKLNWAHGLDEVDVLLDLSGANEVREHAAGDLVVRAQAGTPLTEVQRIVGEAGQQLSIDQPSSTATVGGVIATSTSGPCRHLFGSVRDLLIGITVVRADGVVTISGGKVVKNVAGYDLGKLYTGSYGTLGVITEAIFRLHPVAAEHRWISVATPDGAAAGQVVDAIRHSQAMPTAIEVDRPVPGGPITVCAQIEGRTAATHERARELAAAVGSGTEVLDTAPQWWAHYPFDPASGIGLRLGVEPSATARLLAGAQDAAQRCGLPLTIRGAAGLGVLQAGLPPDAAPESVADLVAELRVLTAKEGGYAVVLCAPPEVRAVVDMCGPIPAGVHRLMRRTKDQFDPDHRLAPGRFVGGI